MERGFAIRKRMNLPRKKSVIGILIDPVSCEEATDLVIAAARQGRPYSVSAMAVHGVMTGVLDREHRYRLNKLELVVADGQPVRWALNLLHGAGLRERVYGPNLMLAVLARAEQEDIPVFFYGSSQEVLDLMCGNIRQRFPKIRIAGAQPSTFGRISADSAEQISSDIKQSGAQIVFAGLGCPRQEAWAYEFHDRLKIPILAVGAAFPFMAGTLRQAPRWMQDRGLEWLFRLCMEPRRLWRRYLLLSPLYIVLVLFQWLGFHFNIDGDQPVHEILYG
jgi:N-acetylglucosaminyldiphosphoundecaprenol N-acetyl-beta-D-mannosaminyltransferase